MKKIYEAKGYVFYWSREDAVEERKLKRYEIIYEKDNINKLKTKFVDKSGKVLIGKKKK